MSCPTDFGYGSWDEMGHTRKRTFSLPYKEPNLVPVQVQTAVVMSEDSDPWGMDHNKKKKRQV